MIIKIKNDGTKAIIGARRYIALSAFRGIICSFSNNLIASATVCNIPKGPALSGPTLDCIPATNFLSSHINNIVLAVSYTHLRAHETPEHRGWAGRG